MAAAHDGSPAPVADDPSPQPERGFTAPEFQALEKLRPGSLGRQLVTEPFAFDFFQAVRLMEKLLPGRVPLGHKGPPENEVVRLITRQSLVFPPSALYDLKLPSGDVPLPLLTVAFLGLTGASGVLPRHYTEMILRLEREVKGPERYALRDWLDLFNHRLLSHFYRSWVKYRFYIPCERGEYSQREPDVFTQSLLGLMGLNSLHLRNRLRVVKHEVREEGTEPTVLAQINDLALFRFGGFLAHQPRCAISLQAMLRGYLKLPVEVQQHQGHWLRLEPPNQSKLGHTRHNNAMGSNVVVGDRVWDIQSKIRIRLGPLKYSEFLEFLPDPTPTPQRKSIFLLAHLVRLYLGMEIDAEFQLVLKADEVPGCQLGAKKGFGSRLGWNTWGRRKPMNRHGDEPVFQAEERTVC